MTGASLVDDGDRHTLLVRRDLGAGRPRPWRPIPVTQEVTDPLSRRAGDRLRRVCCWESRAHLETVVGVGPAGLTFEVDAQRDAAVCSSPGASQVQFDAVTGSGGHQRLITRTRRAIGRAWCRAGPQN